MDISITVSPLHSKAISNFIVSFELPKAFSSHNFTSKESTFTFDEKEAVIKNDKVERKMEDR